MRFQRRKSGGMSKYPIIRGIKEELKEIDELGLLLGLM